MFLAGGENLLDLFNCESRELIEASLSRVEAAQDLSERRHCQLPQLIGFSRQSSKTCPHKAVQCSTNTCKNHFSSPMNNPPPYFLPVLPDLAKPLPPFLLLVCSFTVLASYWARCDLLGYVVRPTSSPLQQLPHFKQLQDPMFLQGRAVCFSSCPALGRGSS